MTGIDLDNGAGFPELTKFQEHFHDSKIIVYEGLHCDRMFDGQVESSKRQSIV